MCALAVIALGLCAGCVQRSAPVVDSPVWDGAPKRPAPSAKPASPSAPAPGTAATPPGTAASRSSAAAASSSAPAPASSASSAASSPSPAPAPRADSPAARASGDAEALPEFYSVRKGDTLYSIALDNGQDYKDVAAWNGLTDANLIRVDQQLRVRPPPGWSEPAEDDGGVVARPVSPPSEIQARPLEAPPVKKTPKALKARYSEQALAQMRGAPFKPVPEPAAPAANVPPGAPVGAQAAPSTARARPA
ncbi:MAG TPA: LysM peptidoglycan-binding domain-containing protein, partial [Burkholderiales bacterium]|nr:LysM peptidoglycan-binding domain-containing protein [Burkholderiales bacterium]